MSQRMGSDNSQWYNDTTLFALSRMTYMACSQEQIVSHPDPAPLAWFQRNRHHDHGYGYDDYVESHRTQYENSGTHFAHSPRTHTREIGSIPVTSSLTRRMNRTSQTTTPCRDCREGSSRRFRDRSVGFCGRLRVGRASDSPE